MEHYCSKETDKQSHQRRAVTFIYGEVVYQKYMVHITTKLVMFTWKYLRKCIFLKKSDKINDYEKQKLSFKAQNLFELYLICSW